MTEEYVSTFVDDRRPGDASAMVTETQEPERRTYALGADRRGQLKTTDLFPKRLWVIAVCGLLMTGIAIGLNALNVYAPAWRPLIGDAAAQAISLNGPGTLAGWMMSVILLLTGLSSLQIFALRQHRCDDYGGTYRVWLLVPPIFLVASAASIVDFGSIFGHLVALGQLTWLGDNSLVPMTFKLSLLAIVMARMLFEVRDSRSASAALVTAWLAVAVSIVLGTPWAAERIANQELAMVYPNAVFAATIALFLTHLFYVRFVYLHAHGVIAPKEKLKPTKQQKPKPVRQSRRAKTSAAKKPATTEPVDPKTNDQSHTQQRDESAPAAASVSTSATGESKEPSPPSAHSGKRPKKKKQIQPASPELTAVNETSNPSPQTPKQKSTTMSDFQALLKKKQSQRSADQEALKASPAAAANSTAADAASAAESFDDSDAQIPTGKMTKAQRRRARKAAKNNRKAA